MMLASERNYLLRDGLIESLVCVCAGRLWSNDDVGAESAEFRGEALFRIDLEIEECCGDGCACAEGEQNDDEAAAIGGDEPADDAPKHGA